MALRPIQPLATWASGLVFSLVAVRISREPPNLAYTYGMERVEVLSAFSNGVVLASSH